ncbi:FCD domain-containing protein [Rhodoplanes sp. TEM]|uniref:FCD domain-containing protein n=1 Tax=Rhodoplanes tepidamans TaxID=200616 RepID=A0ABT5JA36_RHOTP|nr:MULTISPECIES: FCD domain-containing protein [Rhodoplanes]MDC7786318.1 FCD domain-containing protein [Rhodoplanes tepidamans]MDC7984723.1 FCD domain-containing protein [Rhodoplanes sp. TEM]MDQ0354061.1 DNA-binding GntR family transcriptional regulator [Rhodoplanes tepidamans]
MDQPDIRTIAQAVQGRLSTDILFGRLKPDDRLRLEPLCEAYAVGMSPIREALAQLVGRGLVIQDGQRGFRVAPISRRDLDDIAATRIRLEGMALRDAIAHGDDAWEARILAAHHRLARRPRTPDKLVDEDWETLHRGFHLALIDACGSPLLLAFCHDLHDRFDRYRRIAVQAAGRHPRITGSAHAAIVEAALARDADRAATLLDRHIAEAAADIARMGAPRFPDAEAARPARGTSLAETPARSPARRRVTRDARPRPSSQKGRPR